MSHILLACGGTGGHLAPGIALAQRLSQEGHDCLLMVSGKAVDAQMTAKYQRLKFVVGRGRGFGPGLKNKIKFFPAFIGSLVSAWRLISHYRPHVLVCFGGFMSLAPALVCAWRGIPVLVHEANRRPGKAVRLIARFATSVHLPVGVRLGGVPAERQQDSGFPVRQEITPSAREVARHAIGIPTQGRMLFITGGSQGAKILTRWVENHLADFAERGIHVLCLTGSGGLEKEVRTPHSVVRFQSFCHQMGSAYSAADLAITRAGAGTLAELATCRTPSILIPYALAADNHQAANADYFVEVGAALLCSEKHVSELARHVFELLSDNSRLATMRDALAMLDATNRWEEIYHETVKRAKAQEELRS